MSCLHPVPAWRNTFSDFRLKKRAAPFFKAPPTAALLGGTVKSTPLPCGRCLGCRLDYSRQWAMRGVCELQMNSRSCFATLTYAPEHLPPDRSLQKEHYQKFFKRLRKAGFKFTYMIAGEYGEKLGRPHYHVIFFGEDFKKNSTMAPVKQTKLMPLYCSPDLSKKWGMGHVVVGDVSFQSIQYVAGYITKKINGEKAAEHYQGKKPEFMKVSLKQPIGASWFDKYMSDVYPRDVFIYKGKEMRPPKYFQKRYAKLYPEKALELSVNREIFMESNSDQFTPEALHAKEEILISKFKQRLRLLEKELAT